MKATNKMPAPPTSLPRRSRVSTPPLCWYSCQIFRNILPAGISRKNAHQLKFQFIIPKFLSKKKPPRAITTKPTNALLPGWILLSLGCSLGNLYSFRAPLLVSGTNLSEHCCYRLLHYHDTRRQLEGFTIIRQTVMICFLDTHYLLACLPNSRYPAIISIVVESAP